MAHRTRLFVVLLLAMVLVAAACGSSGDDNGADGGGAEDQSDAVATDTDADGDDEGTAAAGEPVRGGTLVYGMEADSANPWPHYGVSCAISCLTVFRAIGDPLFFPDENGEFQPYLAESVESNDDGTQWTTTIRDGIMFHDGTMLDGEAVAYNLWTCQASPLTGPAFAGVGEITFDGMDVIVNYDAPSAIGPSSNYETCGTMFSKAWLETLPTNPLLTDEERAAATGNPAEPVSLGPFKFVSYTPGNGNAFVAERFEDYWRGDGPNSVTGEGLPYLDGVELVVAVDIQGRANGLRSGEFDIIHTANADEIARFQDDDEFELLAANDYGETSYIMLNNAAGDNPFLGAMDPAGSNADSPLLHLSCRKALAHAIDRQRVADQRGAGLVEPANGPYPPGSIGHLEDNGYPEFDLEAAATEWETCKADNGTVPISFDFNTTNDAFNVESNELIVSMWTDAFGDEVDVSITPIEQGQYIGLALAGTFNALGWRSHGGIDPGEQWFWWNTITAAPIGESALNFGRFQDPVMDEQFVTIRQNSDPDARKEAAEQVNRQFGENVWNFWTTWTLWGIISSPRVQNITDLSLPDGEGTVFPIINGRHRLTQIWCLEGNCQG